MILWTIQFQHNYEKMKETRVLRADPTHINNESFRDAYEWMAKQMKTRITPPPDNVVYPVWAWYCWEGIRKKPDMRFHGRGWGPKGSKLVLLTVDIPDKFVLLSDFDDWHAVLRNEILLYPKNSLKLYSQAETEQSWNGIFDISCSIMGTPQDSLSIQATMWEIQSKWIKKVKFFISH